MRGNITMNRKSINVWELEKGIKVKTKKRKETYSEKQFKRLINKNYIVTKTEKGLEYLESFKKKGV